MKTIKTFYNIENDSLTCCTVRKILNAEPFKRMHWFDEFGTKAEIHINIVLKITKEMNIVRFIRESIIEDI